MTERITISVPDELAEQINQQLSYGDNRSEWIRAAIEQRLEDVERPTTVDEPRARTHETDALREQLREELAGSGDLLDARVDEVLKMYDYLREHGTAEKSDLLDVVDVEETGYQGRDSVWSNMIKGRDTLRALPGVETPATGKTTWRYTE